MSDISHQMILSYQADWPDKFNKEKKVLEGVFSAEALAIEHIGSTSIPNLSSKPIIDMVVLVKNKDIADSFSEQLKNIGYNEVLPPGNERHFFTKGKPIEYHLSIAYTDRGGFWVRQMKFRDYMRTHPELVDEYDKLKRKLLAEDPTGYDVYINKKSDFVNKVLELSGWTENVTYNEFYNKNF